MSHPLPQGCEDPEPKAKATPEYAVVLLRFRRSGNDPWRVALINANGEEIGHFASLAALFAYLWKWLQ